MIADALKEFSLYTIPWWVWCAPVAGAALKIGFTLGWRNAGLAVLSFLSAAIFFISRHQARQQGFKDHEEKSRLAAEALVKRVNSARDSYRRTRPGLKRLHEDDGFKRPGD